MIPVKEAGKGVLGIHVQYLLKAVEAGGEKVANTTSRKMCDVMLPLGLFKGT